ncbi:MAG: hypothetical protein ABSH41_01695 [Syntrophobacteraceae bacterium]|jgi:hypothetical protein
MKGSVVCNTGPLIALAIVNKLDLLKLLFTEIVVPETVQPMPRLLFPSDSMQGGLPTCSPALEHCPHMR